MLPIPTVLSVLYLDPCKFGSMEEYILFLSRELRRRGGRSVLVFSCQPPEAIAEYFRQAGAEMETFRDQNRRQRHLDLFRLIRKYRPAVVHFHFFNQFSILPLLAALAGAGRVLFTDHVRQPQNLSLLTRWKCLLWDRLVLRLLGVRVLAVSQHIKQTLVSCYRMAPQRVQVVHNGVNARRFVAVPPPASQQLREELALVSGEAVVVCVAALRPEKGVDDFLAAAKKVLESRPQSAFLVVGDGPMAEPLRRLAASLAISARVRFLGLRSDVNRFVALADVVVTPSTWQEPAGLVLLEAMAAARPVVATRVGGIPEHVQDGETGILVPPRSPEQLAQAILGLLANPGRAREMGAAGRRRVENLFSMERWVEDTLQAYPASLNVERTIV